jgi:hypothetical protein
MLHSTSLHTQRSVWESSIFEYREIFADPAIRSVSVIRRATHSCVFIGGANQCCGNGRMPPSCSPVFPVVAALPRTICDGKQHAGSTKRNESVAGTNRREGRWRPQHCPPRRQPTQVVVSRANAQHACPRIPATRLGMAARVNPYADNAAPDQSRAPTSSHSVPDASDISSIIWPSVDIGFRQQHLADAGEHRRFVFADP